MYDNTDPDSDKYPDEPYAERVAVFCILAMAGIIALVAAYHLGKALHAWLNTWLSG